VWIEKDLVCFDKKIESNQGCFWFKIGGNNEEESWFKIGGNNEEESEQY
jgi:hypothetical protein